MVLLDSFQIATWRIARGLRLEAEYKPRGARPHLVRFVTDEDGVWSCAWVAIE